MTGLLTQIDFIGSYFFIGNRKRKMYKFLCDCGNIRYLRIDLVKRGLCKSCGCMWGKWTKTHGMSFDRVYKVWHSLEQRCHNKNHKHYKNYGGRGIECKRNNFQEFYNDIGYQYKEGLTIDRIDNNGNYCKENCRRATRKEQQNNTRHNLIIEYNGKIMTATAWGEYLGVRPNLIIKRINRGRDKIRAITENIERYKTTQTMNKII